MSLYKSPMQYFEVEPGVEIYYEDRGKGPAIVFVPGWTFTSEMFCHQLEHFSKTHRVVVMNPRSHGPSSISQHGNDYPTQAADLAKLIRHLGLDDFVLVGWSFGCLTTWGYIRQEGLAGVKGMVMIDLSPKPLSEDPTDWVEGPLDEIAEAYNGFLLHRGGQRDFVSAYAQEVMVQREMSPEEAFWIVEQALGTPTHIAAALFASGMFSNYLEEARLVDEKIPALSIIAEHWAETAVAFMNKHCPKTKTTVLGGHAMFWEHPEKFNRILEDFLAAL